MRGKAFKGNPNSIALWQPWIAPAHYQTTGIPLGFDLRTGKVVVFNPWSLPTHSTTFGIEGEKNSGKSTFLKTVVGRLMGLQGKDAYDNPCLMRGRINSRKSEQGVAEFGKLSDALYSPVYDLGETSINLFGLLKSEADLIEVTIMIAQEINKGPIGVDIALAYMVGIRNMLRDAPEVVSPPVLEVILRNLTLRDFIEYHQTNNNELHQQFEEELLLRPNLKEQLQINNYDTTVDQSNLDAAKTAANLLGQLLRGDYGRSFGGKNNLYDVLSQQLTTLNWETMPENARNILEAVLMKAEASAIVRAKNGTGSGLDLSTIIPHVNMSDEEGGAMKSPMHARFMADRQNKSRAYPTADFRAVQYYSQVTKAGDADSAMRGLAEEIELGVGCRFIFRQPDDTTFLERFSRLGMSDPDVAFLPKLGQGQAVIWLRDHTPLYYQHVVTAPELPLIQTNSQRQSMVNTTPVWDNAKFQQRARELGVTKIGGDHS